MLEYRFSHFTNTTTTEPLDFHHSSLLSGGSHFKRAAVVFRLSCTFVVGGLNYQLQ